MVGPTGRMSAMSKKRDDEVEDVESEVSEVSEDVAAQQDPNAQQAGVSLANQDWEQYRAETPAVQNEGAPTANESSPIKGDAPSRE